MHKNKALVSLVFGLGFILIMGIVLLGYGLYQRASDPEFKFFKSSNDNPTQISSTVDISADLKSKLPVNVSIPLAKGSQINKIEVSGKNIVVHITNEAKRDLLLILDAETGTIMRQIRFDHPQ